MNGLIVSPPIKSPFDDIDTKGPSFPWLKWFQNLISIFNTAYQAYTPTVASEGGAITTSSATGRFKQVGRTVFVEIEAVITTNGTGSIGVHVGLPVPATGSANQLIPGRANAVSGKMLQGRILTGTPTVMVVFNYDNSYPGADGEHLLMTGSYEAA